MNQPIAGHNIEVLGQQLYLHPLGSVFWPNTKTLLVADLHLGCELSQSNKASQDQSSSTKQSYQHSIDTLNNLKLVIEAYHPERVIILGDLLHGRNQLANPIAETLARFCYDHSDISFSLVLGNHDRHHRDTIAKLPIEVLSPPYWVAPFWLVHDSENESPSANQLHRLAALISDEEAVPAQPCDSPQHAIFVLGGHMHPALRQPDAIGQAEKSTYKCFVCSADSLILPAMSTRGRSRIVTPSPNVKLFPVVNGKVTEISSQPNN